jgi:predicted TIM-barrel fold metal-dependent hydrolase
MTTIVDTHVHVVAQDREQYPLAPGVGVHAWYDKQPADVGALLAEMDGAGVHGTIMVQGHGAYSYDNSYCADAREAAPDRLGSVSIIDMTRPDRNELLTYWAQRGMRGTRLFHIPIPETPWLDDEATLPFWRQIEALGVRTNICIVRQDLPRLARLLEWAPPVPISLDHCGLIELPGFDATRAQLEQVLALSRFANVHLKVSTNVFAFAPLVGLTPPALVRELADVYSADRLMWCSDWPQVHDRSYAQLVHEGIEAGSLLSDSERDSYLGGTALSIWPELTPAQNA